MADAQVETAAISAGTGSGGGVLAYGVAVFMGALLLFQIEPLIGKYILPWFGGSPAVWTVCMLFFQILLLAGYAYAHVSVRFLRPAAQATVHVALLALAVGVMAFTRVDAWKPVKVDAPVFQIITLLAVCIGLPFFVLSATGPLLQAWFARANPGKSPYRLYALSNAGSLIALVTYPLAIEPTFTRRAQVQLWWVGLAVFGAICALVALRARHARPAAVPAAGKEHGFASFPLPVETVVAPGWARRAMWLLLPMCASVLLLAATNKICQDVAVVPFLWVLPLSLYLLSFILAFDHSWWYQRWLFALLFVAALAGVVWALFQGVDASIRAQISVHCAAVFVGCMICHGEVFRLRPAPAGLTGYFLTIAAGGALGGTFVALAAPHLFNRFIEYQIALVGTAVLLLAALWLDPASPLHRGRQLAAWMASSVVMACLVIAFVKQLDKESVEVTRTKHVDASGNETWTNRIDAVTVSVSRNFYGVLSVKERDPDKPASRRFALFHGGINHGLQYAPGNENEFSVTTYYTSSSGVGMAIRAFPRRTQRIGVVGLGTGSIAAYAEKGDYFRFYEINPEVIRLASSRFTYLRHVRELGAVVDVVEGDARLSMESEAPQDLDLIVLDAFSGDAVPTHLLTREAFETYYKHLRPDGVIAVHATNKHLWLPPVIGGLAAEFGRKAVLISDNAEEQADGYATDWVLVTNNRAVLDSEPVRLHGEDPKRGKSLWTDEHTSLFEILKK